MWARSDWLAEGRWERRALRDALPDLNLAAHHGASPRGRIGLSSQGTWSSGMYLPTGAVIDRRTGRACAWQIEHNGGWHWEVGEFAGRGYLALLGPDRHRAPLAPAPGPGRELHDRAGHRRRERRGLRGRRRDADRGPAGRTAAAPRSRPAAGDLQRLHEHPDGRPDHRRAAAADRGGRGGRRRVLLHRRRLVRRDGEGWWDTVGAWKPSTTRFPGGLGEVLDRDPRGRHGAGPVAGAGGRRGAQPGRRAAARPRRSSSATGSGSSSTAGTTSTCATRPRSSTWTRWWTAWSATSGSATSSSTTTSTPAPAPTADGGSAGAGLLGAQPGPPGLARPGAGPPPRPDHRELRVRRHAHGLRHAVPAPAAVHQRPAGLPALRRRSRPPRPPPSRLSRPRSGPTRSPASPTTRSRSPCAARCSAASTCPGTWTR